MMILIDEQWWNDDDMYSDIMMIFTMWWSWYIFTNENWYLQNNDGIFTMRYYEIFMRWNEKKNYMMMSIYTISKILNFNYPLPPTSHSKKNIIDACFFCDAWRCLGWKRIYCKVGTPTPLLGAPSSHECKWLPVRLMGPLCSPQPSTGKLSWCPPVESWGVACLLVCHSQELEWQLLEQTQWLGLQDLRLQVLQTLEETVGELGNWGLGGHGMVEVVKEEGGSTRWLPSRVCKNLLPQIPLWPPLVSPTPPSLAAGPPLPVS